MSFEAEIEELDHHIFESYFLGGIFIDRWVPPLKERIY